MNTKLIQLFFCGILIVALAGSNRLDAYYRGCDRCHCREHRTCCPERVMRTCEHRHHRHYCCEAYFHHHDGHHAHYWHDRECHPAHDKYGEPSPHEHPGKYQAARYGAYKRISGRYPYVPNEMGPNISPSVFPNGEPN